jgi:hypothetical protein
VWLNSAPGWGKGCVEDPVAPDLRGADGPCQLVVDRSACPARTDQSASLPFPAWSSLPVHSPAPPRMQRSGPRMLLDSTRQWEAAIFRSLRRPLLTPSALPLAATRHAQCPALFNEKSILKAKLRVPRETSPMGNAVMWHHSSCQTCSGLRQAEIGYPTLLVSRLSDEP